MNPRERSRGILLYSGHMASWIVGIDEVGRGPLAGPVAVGAVRASAKTLRRFRDIRESKQLSPRARAEWAKRIADERGPELEFAVAFVAASTIDRIGINPAIARALARAIGRIGVDPAASLVLLDGGLRAPDVYPAQRTIIRGDASETVIAMASVVAKVARDARMAKLSRRYPEYGFERHVGYGTAAHIAAILRHGPTSEHRLTFLRSVLQRG